MLAGTVQSGGAAYPQPYSRAPTAQRLKLVDQALLKGGQTPQTLAWGCLHIGNGRRLPLDMFVFRSHLGGC
jgi:hypothetical protein